LVLLIAMPSSGWCEGTAAPYHTVEAMRVITTVSLRTTTRAMAGTRGVAVDWVSEWSPGLGALASLRA
jgi:hypothetical protein